MDPDNPENDPMGRTTNAYANRPTTMDGTPVRTSAMKRTVLPSRALGNSLTQIAAPRPMGIAISTAHATTNTLPTSALAIPPPDSPGGKGKPVRKFQSIADAPL